MWPRGVVVSVIPIVRAKAEMQRGVGGLPYMTSVVGGGRGFPKSRRKEQNQLICDSDKGGGVKKSKNFVDVMYGIPQC